MAANRSPGQWAEARRRLNARNLLGLAKAQRPATEAEATGHTAECFRMQGIRWGSQPPKGPQQEPRPLGTGQNVFECQELAGVPPRPKARKRIPGHGAEPRVLQSAQNWLGSGQGLTADNRSPGRWADTRMFRMKESAEFLARPKSHQQKPRPRGRGQNALESMKLLGPRQGPKTGKRSPLHWAEARML